jgi:hypothetical protein
MSGNNGASWLCEDIVRIRNNEVNLKIAKASHRFLKVCGRLAVRQALRILFTPIELLLLQ